MTWRSASLLALTVLAAPTWGQEARRSYSAQLEALAERLSPGVAAVLTPARRPRDTDGGIFDFQARGTAFLVDDSGHMVTDQAFVGDARQVDLVMQGGLRATARVLGGDDRLNVAILRLNDLEQLKTRMGGRLRPLPLGSAAKLRPGQAVLGLANAFDSLVVDGQPAFTRGVVSYVGRRREGDYRGLVIQTDAAVNPGCFGSPLLDRDGRVVGVVTRSFSTRHWLGEAVPIDPVLVALETIRDGRPLAGARLGLSVLGQGGKASSSGLEVKGIDAGGPAFQAGVRAGDRLLAIDGRELRDADDLAEELADLTPGTPARLRLSRNGKVQDLVVGLGVGEPLPAVVVAARPEPTPEPRNTPPLARPQAPQSGKASLGVALRPREAGGLEVAKLVEGGAAEAAGLKLGDVLLAFDGAELTNTDVLLAALAKRAPGDTVTVKIEREGWTRELEVRLGGPLTVQAPGKASGFLGLYLAPSQTRARVAQVIPGSPAEQAGLKVGDVVLRVNGHEVGLDELVGMLRGISAGDTLRLVVRDSAGKDRLVTVVAAPRPEGAAPGQPAPTPAPAPEARPWLGVQLEARGGKLTITAVAPGSPAASAKLEAGDAILRLDGAEVSSLDAFAQRFGRARPGATVELEVERGGWTKTLKLEVGRQPR